MATLNIRNSFELEVNGRTITGNHGETTDGATDDFGISVDGKVSYKPNVLADDAIVTLWDEDAEKPEDFKYFFLWASRDCYLQVVGASTNFVVKLTGKVPFVLSTDDILAAANTTPVTAGVAPSTETVDSLILSNVSGSELSYVSFLVD